MAQGRYSSKIVVFLSKTCFGKGMVYSANAFLSQSIAFFIEMAVSVYLQYNFIDVVIDQGIWFVKKQKPEFENC